MKTIQTSERFDSKSCEIIAKWYEILRKKIISQGYPCEKRISSSVLQGSGTNYCQTVPMFEHDGSKNQNQKSETTRNDAKRCEIGRILPPTLEAKQCETMRNDEKRKEYIATCPRWSSSSIWRICRSTTSKYTVLFTEWNEILTWHNTDDMMGFMKHVIDLALWVILNILFAVICNCSQI